MPTNMLVQPLLLKGSHREIGQAHGEEYRESIRELTELLRQNFELRGRVQAGRKLVQDLARKYWPYSVEYDPDLGDEIEGIAQGSGLEITDVVLLNAFLDLVSMRNDRVAANLLGCTSFAAAPEATSNSKCYVGQNYDMEAFYRKFGVLLQLSADGTPPCLVYTYTGVVGCAGLNSAGIGLSINFLHPYDANVGVIYPFIVRKILSQTRIGDALGAATIGYRAGGVNLLIADEHGLIFDVETSARDHDILLPENGVIAHTNHYLSPRMRAYDLVIGDPSYDSAISRRGSTVVRWYKASRTLRDHLGRIDSQLLQRIACDHTNYPYSICFHGDAEQDELCRGETSASMIFDLADRKMLFVQGHPCEGEYAEILLTG